MFGFVRAGWRAAVYYPSRIAIDVIRPIMAVIVTVALIRSIAALSGSEELLGMDILSLTVYYAAFELMAEIPTFIIPWRIQDDVSNGKISIILSRPAEPSTWYFLFGLGRALPGLLAISCMLGVLAIITGYWANLPAFLLMVFIFTMFRTLYDATTGLFSAWTYHIGYLRRILNWITWGFLGGKIVPLHILPDWFQKLTYYLPFRYLGYDAVNTLLYGFDARAFIIGALWIVPMFLVYRWLYYRAVRRMEAFGG